MVHYLSTKIFHWLKPLIGYRPNITIIDISDNSFTEKVPWFPFIDAHLWPMNFLTPSVEGLNYLMGLNFCATLIYDDNFSSLATVTGHPLGVLHKTILKFWFMLDILFGIHWAWWYFKGLHLFQNLRQQVNLNEASNSNPTCSLPSNWPEAKTSWSSKMLSQTSSEEELELKQAQLPAQWLQFEFYRRL